LMTFPQLIMSTFFLMAHTHLDLFLFSKVFLSISEMTWNRNVYN
jgi:hypothetical protein